MTETSATIPIPGPTLACYVPARAPTTGELVASPHVSDDLLNITEAKP